MKIRIQAFPEILQRIFLQGYILCFISLLVMIIMAVVFDGTADEGDSITHYLLAKSARQHPELFFDHWGKPVFTLIVNPIAQLPFTGMKIFNAILFSLGLFLTVAIAQKLELKYSFFIPVIALFTPHYVMNSLSGLTEPMFNLALLIVLWFFINKKDFTASAIASFLPFIRSEGLIILVLAAAYLIYSKKYRYIPLLVLGHVVYSLLGHFLIEKPFLWVFTEMTYGELRSNYGKGTWTEFFFKSPSVFGIPGLLLIVTGTIHHAWLIFKKRGWQSPYFGFKVFLIFGTAYGLFFFHVFAWGMGWFHSFGLTRVLNGVMGPFLLISIFGLEFLISLFRERWHRIIAAITACLIVFVPLLNKKFGFDYEKQFKLKAMQRVISQAADVIREFYPDYNDRVICYEASYLAVELNLDFYDREKRSIMGYNAYKNMPAGSLLVWDEWYAVTQGQTPLEVIQNDDSFKKIAEFKDYEPWDIWDEPHYAVVFEKIK